MRLYEGTIAKPLHDIREDKYKLLHARDNYLDSQSFGQSLQSNKSWGLVYNSVRHSSGTCIAALRLPAISIPKPISHLKYIWNGNRMTEILDTQVILKI